MFQPTMNIYEAYNEAIYEKFQNFPQKLEYPEVKFVI